MDPSGTTSFDETGLLAAVFDAASDGLCLVAPDGTILRVNERWLHATGFRTEQVVGVDILELFPESRALIEPLHARARAGERVAVRHRQVVLGRASWWEGVLAPVRMDGGTGLLVTAHEVPPPEQGPPGGMGAGGAAQDRMLGSLVRIMQEGLLTVDLDFNVTYWSPGAERLLGWSEADLLGRYLFDFTRPNPAASGIDIFKQRVLSGELLTETGPRRRKDGTIAVLESSYTVLRGADGAPTGMLAVARDVTEAVAAEEAIHAQQRRLAESEARLARVLSGSMDGFFDLDLSTGTSTWSDRVAQLLGRDPRDGPRSSAAFTALLQPDDAAALDADVARVCAGAQEAVERDVCARHADGSWRWLRVRARVTARAPGETRHFSGTVSDITELRQSLEHVRTLKGLLPICVHCHKIRDDQGYWDRIDKYIAERTDASFSHGLCPDCFERYYPIGR